MRRARVRHQLTAERLHRVVEAASSLPEVDVATKYDGSSFLRLRGCFMAGPARHRSAEPHSLVVRVEPEERALWLDEAPDVYYLTDYYRPYPLVLVRLDRLAPAALRDLLATSWRLTAKKGRRRRTARIKAAAASEI